MDFCHLHLHSEYSLLDGACKISRLIKKIKDLNMSSVAITDHGVMFGVPSFYKECINQGIKPIIGCEVYVAPNSRFEKNSRAQDKYYHLVLLAKNNVGYHNLMKLTSLSFTEGFYYKPRVDDELLEKYSEGLICLSACLGGEIQSLLVDGEYEKAEKKALKYKNIFEDFYIELQNHYIDEQKRILPMQIKIARDNDIPLVCTNDCHYIEKDEDLLQEILMCISTNSHIGDPKMEFLTKEFYVKSSEEMAELFKEFPDAVENTKKIADMCDVSLDFSSMHLPKYKIETDETAIEMLTRLCNDGIKKRYGDKLSKTHTERLNYELSVINQMGFVDYFLIVWDFIKYAKTNNIPVGPGRGSGAGSIVAYSLEITDIDPIKYGLLFERFLNPERVTMPDIDVDFCYENRQKVIDYVNEKYGSDHVSQIITFGTMAAKAAIRDVGRAMDLSYSYVDTVAKAIPFGLTIDEALENSQKLKKMYDEDEQCKKLIDFSRKVEGMPRHSSTHAAGVVITEEPTMEYVPLATSDSSSVTQYTMTVLEELGLLKMDFLGLRNLTIIKNCENLIKKNNPSFDIKNIDYNDKKTYEMISAGDTFGVFQLESNGMRATLSNLKPENLEDIIAVISLYRPGPVESIPKYIECKNDNSKVSYKHPLLKDILDVTYGCIVYQEQVMQIVQKLAGYSLGRADLLRRAMSKKKVDVMEKERQYFLYGLCENGKEIFPGAIKNGVSEKIANEIFDEMSSFAKYAFNKSHAAAYAHISFQTAYLKCHYSCEYMSALMGSVLDNLDKVCEYIGLLPQMGLKLLPPDVNSSSETFEPLDKRTIKFGLTCIKNIGRNFIRQLVKEREENGPFTSFYEFCLRMADKDLNKKAVESLIKCGAMDCFGYTRRSLLESCQEVCDAASREKMCQLSGQMGLFGNMEDSFSRTMITERPEYDRNQILAFENEVSGFYISGHPMKEYIEDIKKIGGDTIFSITNSVEENDGNYYDGKNVTIYCMVSDITIKKTKKDERMAFITLNDSTAQTEGILFPATFRKYEGYFNENTVYKITGRISLKEDDGVKILISDALPVNPKELSSSGKLYIILQKRDEIMDDVIKLLKLYPGNTNVYFYIKQEEKWIKSKNISCDRNDELIKTLKNVLGEENIITK